jgi:hypothetical protein
VRGMDRMVSENITPVRQALGVPDNHQVFLRRPANYISLCALPGSCRCRAGRMYALPEAERNHGVLLMENPATWGPAEKVVDDAYERWFRLRSQGYCGLSLARQITDALREAGLLKEDA